MRVPVTFSFCQAMTILIEYHYIELKEPDGKAKMIGTQFGSSEPEKARKLRK